MDTTTSHLIPFSEGDDTANSIDETSQAMAEHLDEIIAVHASGNLAGRPVSSAPVPGIEGRIYHVNAGTAIGMVNYDTGTGWVTLRDPTPGAAANRPAANAVPAGTRYFATDTLERSISNGATWLSETPAAIAAFAAYGTYSNIASGGQRKITFDTDDSAPVTFDRGGVFDPATSRFTAPVKGIYEFTLAPKLDAATIAAGKTVDYRHKRNGVVDSLAPLLEQLTPIPGTVTATERLQLNANDYLEVMVKHGDAGNNDVDLYRCIWTGVLLAQIP